MVTNTLDNAVVVELAGKPLTRADLDKAFDKVKNPDHWKNPCRGLILEAEVPIVELAVMFFTGTKLRVVAQDGEGNVSVEADGYWGGPCN